MTKRALREIGLNKNTKRRATSLAHLCTANDRTSTIPRTTCLPPTKKTKSSRTISKKQNLMMMFKLEAPIHIPTTRKIWNL